MHFHLYANFFCAVDDGVQFLAALSRKVVGLDFGDSLDVFQNFFNLRFVGQRLFHRRASDCKAHENVHKLKGKKARRRDKSYPPVKEKYHHDDKRGIQKALHHKHDGSCGHVAHKLHRVCRHACDLSKRVLVKVSHRNIAQMLGDLDSLLRASPVAAFCLPHRNVFLCDNSRGHAKGHYAKGKPNRFRAKGFRSRGRANHALHHYRDGGNS